MLLIIDNYDSFTYNLASYFCELNHEVKVYRNDKISISDIKMLKPDYIVLSPGPCTPVEAGICKQIIREFYDKIPILGVCLGHQAIASAFDGEIIRAPHPVHGMQDTIFAFEDEIFHDIDIPFLAARYHSLIVKKDNLPKFLNIIAENTEGLVMAIRHASYPCYGFQFHPESILTPDGKQLLINFLRIGMKNV